MIEGNDEQRTTDIGALSLRMTSRLLPPFPFLGEYCHLAFRIQEICENYPMKGATSPRKPPALVRGVTQWALPTVNKLPVLLPFSPSSAPSICLKL